MRPHRSLETSPRGTVAGWPLPTLADLTTLSSFEGPCLSLYLPGHRPGGQSQNSVARLRVQLAAAETELTAAGILPTDIDALLSPLRHLEHDPELLEGHRDVLIIFRSIETLQLFRQPGLDLDQLFVGRHFQIAPVLGQLMATPDFYLLQLSRKRVQLLKIDQEGHQEMVLPPEIVSDYEKFKNFDQPDHLLRARSGASGGHGAQSPVSFGTGSEREAESGHFHDFCRSIDRGLHSMLAKHPLPLVIAGTKPEVAAFQTASTYPRVVESSVGGSPEGGTPVAEMVRQGRALVRQWISPELQHVLQLYRELAGSAKAVEELHAIVRAAALGLVEYLAYSPGTQASGNYDTLTERRMLGGEFVATNVDLVNAAIVDTLRHRGKVMPLPEGALTGSASVVAILRY
ncbi:MAG: hypothetical protein NTV70_02245 [Acidobacteria bacterium]|nr:hypothetical protein [Acidobacteriota bacterium]